MAHISTHAGVFSVAKPLLGARSRLITFYVTVAVLAIGLAVPAAIMTAASPPL